MPRPRSARRRTPRPRPRGGPGGRGLTSSPPARALRVSSSTTPAPPAASGRVGAGELPPAPRLLTLVEKGLLVGDSRSAESPGRSTPKTRSIASSSAPHTRRPGRVSAPSANRTVRTPDEAVDGGQRLGRVEVVGQRHRRTLGALPRRPLPPSLRSFAGRLGEARRPARGRAPERRSRAEGARSTKLRGFR